MTETMPEPAAAVASAGGIATCTGESGHLARSEPRKETILRAVVRLRDGAEIPCVVRDVSPSGARLGVPRSCQLPESFMFKINGRDLVFLAKLAWRRGGYAGVRIKRIARLAAQA